MYKINASDVAALIGKNKYKSKEEVFERIAIEHGLIEAEESTLIAEIESKLSPEIEQVLVSTGKDVETTMNAYERSAEKLIITDSVLRVMSLKPILNAPVETPTDVQSALSVICAVSDTKEHAIEQAIQHPIIQKFLKESKQITECAKSINTLRGQKLEETSTDAYQSRSKVEVTHRNSKCYIYRKNSWMIAGRVDGLTDIAVVETKTRRRVWNSPPEYDIIQLRCYMKLCNRQIGILNEQFPDGTSRETRIQWNDSLWTSIEDKIDLAILEFEKTYT